MNLLPRPRPRGSEGFSRSASPSQLVKLLASITKLTELSFQHLLVVGVQHQPRHAAGRGVLEVLVVILGFRLVMWITTMPEKTHF